MFIITAEFGGAVSFWRGDRWGARSESRVYLTRAAGDADVARFRRAFAGARIPATIRLVGIGERVETAPAAA